MFSRKQYERWSEQDDSLLRAMSEAGRVLRHCSCGALRSGPLAMLTALRNIRSRSGFHKQTSPGLATAHGPPATL
jgi:hypothetical protein